MKVAEQLNSMLGEERTIGISRDKESTKNFNPFVGLPLLALFSCDLRGIKKRID
jgi:hypothetical protein